ncbi:MAG: hypothetical protein AABX47_03490 [Nanoarchaeota archaeon]
MELKTGVGGLFVVMIFVLALLLLEIPLVFGQQTCQSGTYNLNGNIKVAGNIEATGTIQGANVKSTSSQTQTSCVLMGTTVVPSTGSTCWDYARDSKIVPLPSCVQTGHCTFLIKAPNDPRPGGVSGFTTFPGVSKMWIADQLFTGSSYGSAASSFSACYPGQTCPKNSPILFMGLFDGQLSWPYNAFQEVILKGNIGTYGGCYIKDDPDNNGANLLLAGESCILPSTCEYWACP